jgi:hypothetical protein
VIIEAMNEFKTALNKIEDEGASTEYFISENSNQAQSIHI